MGTTTAPITVEEFRAMPESERFRKELIDGEIVEMGWGGPEHELLKSNAIRVLMVYLIPNPVGRIFAESTFSREVFAVMPDVSVILRSRLNAGLDHLLEQAPDLAIEIVSSEAAATLERKIAWYLANGSKAVWTVYPAERIVRVYDAQGDSVRLRENDIVRCDLMPGFEAPISAFFEDLPQPQN